MLNKFNIMVNSNIVASAFCAEVCIRYIAKQFWDSHYTEKDKKDYGLVSYAKDEIYIVDENLNHIVSLDEKIKKAVEDRIEEANNFFKRVNKYDTDCIGGSNTNNKDEEEEDFDEEDFEEDFENEEELENENNETSINKRFIDMEDVEENNDYENYFTRDIDYTEDYNLN